MILGSRDEAAAILGLAKQYMDDINDFFYDGDNLDARRPISLENDITFIGRGCSRGTFLGPSRVLYKVDLCNIDPDVSWEYESLTGEAAKFRELRKEMKGDKHFRVPRSRLWRVGKVNLLALEMIYGHFSIPTTHAKYDVDSCDGQGTCMPDLCANSAPYEAEKKYELWDMHEYNMLREDNGKFVVVDVG